MGKVIVLFEAINGKYLQMNPDFKKGEFSSTNSLLDGLEFRFFGFKRSVKANSGNYLHSTGDLIMTEEKEEVRLKAFENLFATLYGEVKQSTNVYPAFVLVKIIQNQDTGTYWSLTADYQLLLKEKEK